MLIRTKKIRTCAKCFKVIEGASAWKNVQKKDRMTELFFHVDCFEDYKTRTVAIEDTDKVQETLDSLLGL